MLYSLMRLLNTTVANNTKPAHEKGTEYAACRPSFTWRHCMLLSSPPDMRV